MRCGFCTNELLEEEQVLFGDKLHIYSYLASRRMEYQDHTECCLDCFITMYKKAKKYGLLNIERIQKRLDELNEDDSHDMDIKPTLINWVKLYTDDLSEMDITYKEILPFKNVYKKERELSIYCDIAKYDQRIHNYCLIKYKPKETYGDNEYRFIPLEEINNKHEINIQGSIYKSLSVTMNYFEKRVCEKCGDEFVWFDQLKEYPLFKFGSPRLSYKKCMECGIVQSEISALYRSLHTWAKVDENKLKEAVAEAMWIDDTSGTEYFIYFIYHKETNRGYVGQTRKPIAFRWNQHLKGLGSTDMHQELIGNPVGWSFEILESGQGNIPHKELLEKESSYMQRKKEEGVELINIQQPKTQGVVNEMS